MQAIRAEDPRATAEDETIAKSVREHQGLIFERIILPEIVAAIQEPLSTRLIETARQQWAFAVLDQAMSLVTETQAPELSQDRRVKALQHGELQVRHFKDLNNLYTELHQLTAATAAASDDQKLAIVSLLQRKKEQAVGETVALAAADLRCPVELAARLGVAAAETYLGEKSNRYNRYIYQRYLLSRLERAIRASPSSFPDANQLLLDLAVLDGHLQGYYQANFLIERAIYLGESAGALPSSAQWRLATDALERAAAYQRGLQEVLQQLDTPRLQEHAELAKQYRLAEEHLLMDRTGHSLAKVIVEDAWGWFLVIMGSLTPVMLPLYLANLGRVMNASTSSSAETALMFLLVTGMTVCNLFGACRVFAPPQYTQMSERTSATVFLLAKAETIVLLSAGAAVGYFRNGTVQIAVPESLPLAPIDKRDLELVLLAALAARVAGFALRAVAVYTGYGCSASSRSHWRQYLALIGLGLYSLMVTGVMTVVISQMLELDLRGPVVLLAAKLGGTAASFAAPAVALVINRAEL